MQAKNEGDFPFNPKVINTDYKVIKLPLRFNYIWEV